MSKLYESLKQLETNDSIEYVLRAEFPGSNAPPPPESGKTAHESWQQRQSARAARRAELLQMPDDEFLAVVRQKQAEDSERDRRIREIQTPRAKVADADFWSREDEWDMCDAALLLQSVEPREGLGLHLKKIINGSFEGGPFAHPSETSKGLSDEAKKHLYEVGQVIRRAGVAHRKGRLAIDGESVEPRAFLRWASDKGYVVPPMFTSLVGDVRSRSTLEAEVKRLEGELARAWDQFDENDAHYPPELDIAFQAWRAVSNEKFPKSGTVRQRLERWIRQHHPDAALKKETIERIATVASWDKQRGRKPKKSK